MKRAHLLHRWTYFFFLCITFVLLSVFCELVHTFGFVTFLHLMVQPSSPSIPITSLRELSLNTPNATSIHFHPCQHLWNPITFRIDNKPNRRNSGISWAVWMRMDEQPEHSGRACACQSDTWRIFVVIFVLDICSDHVTYTAKLFTCASSPTAVDHVPSLRSLIGLGISRTDKVE